MKHHHWILVAMVLGFGAGLVDSHLPHSLVPVYEGVGSLFINALKMVVVPLIAASMITSIASMKNIGSLGRMGLWTVLYYMTTSLAAILVGTTLINLVHPGHKGLFQLGGEVHLAVSGGISQLWTIFERMIPPNIIKAAAEGKLLGIITFSILFGIYLHTASEEPRRTLVSFWQGVLEVMMSMTKLIMRFTPIGVFALVAPVAARTGLEAIRPLLLFAGVVVLGLAIHAFVVLPLILWVLTRRSPVHHYRKMVPALLTAFSTSSSMAALPFTLRCAEDAGISKRIASFVLPIGATVNMDGTALYESVAALFIAQVYGLDLPFTTQVMVVLLALLTSVGVAGVPAASLVAIVIILEAVGLPAQALGIILAVDRPLDMLRTSVNVLSDSCGAAVIDTLERSQAKEFVPGGTDQ